MGNKSHRKHEQRRPRHQIHLSSASILATSLHRLGVQHPSPSRSQLRGLYPGHYGPLLNAKTLPPGFLTSLRALACHPLPESVSRSVGLVWLPLILPLLKQYADIPLHMAAEHQDRYPGTPQSSIWRWRCWVYTPTHMNPKQTQLKGNLGVNSTWKAPGGGGHSFPG